MSKCKVFKHGEYVLALMGLLLGEIPKHLKYGWCVTLIVMWSERYFGPASPNPWPDCSGKRLRAPEGFLPGEHPKQPKFVIGKASYFAIQNFICQEKTTLVKTSQATPANSASINLYVCYWCPHCWARGLKFNLTN